MFRILKRSLDLLLRIIGVLALAVAWLWIVEDNNIREAKPPRDMKTLEDFKRWKPQYEDAERLKVRGSTYYIVYGERSRLLASGPSGYVFDANGNFVGYSYDTGDYYSPRIAFDADAMRTSMKARDITVKPME